MHRTILVTGGAGFIGSALIRHLVHETTAHVINVDCLTYAGNLRSLDEVAESPRYLWENVDIRDRAAVRDIILTHRPDAVFHLAAETHVDRSIDAPSAFIETNLLGTFHLLEAVREFLASGLAREGGNGANVFRFVHVSTDEVYGSLGDAGAFSEESPYRPNSPYAASKAGADHLARAWHRTWGLPVIITNSSNNYGPFQFPEKFIPHLILCALEGRDLPLYGDGGQIRDWLFVEDHVRALVRVLKSGRPGGTYVIGGGAERRNLDVAGEICRALDAQWPRPGGAPHADRITLVADRPGHDRRYAVAADHIRHELGWSPLETFETGLHRTVRWYLERRDWWEPLRQGVYQGERLGQPS